MPWQEAILPYLLVSYGGCLSTGGLALILWPSRTNKLEACTTSTFLEHIAQSRGASMLGLGVAALAAHHESQYDVVMMMTFAVSSALLAAIMLLTQFSPVAVRGRWVAVLISLAWTVGFWYVSVSGSISSSEPIRLVSYYSLTSHLLIESFALWTGITGLLWLLSPGPLSSTMLEKLGPGAAHFATARGAADLPMEMLASTLCHMADRYGIFVQNVALSIIGMIAQLGRTHSSSRWAEELLHIWWAIGSATMMKS